MTQPAPESGQEYPRGLPRFRGPWPFITRRALLADGRQLIWRARDHRKGLRPADRGLEHVTPPLWRTRGFNWTIGLLFAIGSTLFMLGSALALSPPGAAPTLMAINVILFMGSVPFTLAGCLQHFQSANADDDNSTPATAPVKISLIGWRPGSPGWISTLAQLGGAIAFNFNTGDGIHAPAGWLMQDAVIWAPGFIGSILFLISGYLAFIEFCHRYWSWRPREPGWRLVFANLAGCVFYMLSSTLAWVPSGTEPGWIQWSANFWLLLGSLGFLIGGIFAMQEARHARS